jgi:hypothetical protein
MRLGVAILVSCVAALGCKTAEPVVADAAHDGVTTDGSFVDAMAIDAMPIDATVIDPILQGVETYFKASNTGAGDYFGFAIALAGDGNTLAVGAPFEASGASGINGDQLDNSKVQSGAVYVFVRSGATWIQQAYVKASNPDPGDRFGWKIALSGDGNTLAVGALAEASCATGIDGLQQNNLCGDAGAAYVFARNGTTWSQQAYVKASNSRNSQEFSESLALSTDGNTLAVGEPGDPSAAVGINGSQTDTSGSNDGSVFVFTRSGTTWSQVAYVKASNPNGQDVFGTSVALSYAGDVLAVGATGESSAATGINGNQVDNSKRDAGAVYVFTRTGTTWTQDVYVKASNPDVLDDFGRTVALSADGHTLAVGALGEASSATGINGDQTDNTQLLAGALYAFAKVGGTWAQQAYIKEPRSINNDNLGWSLSLSADGNLLGAGAINERGMGTGLQTTPPMGVVPQCGAVYVFRRTGSVWATQHYIKASNAEANDLFGSSVSFSSDGSMLAAGAWGEASAATGVGGNQADNSSTNSGAAYLIQ